MIKTNQQSLLAWCGWSMTVPKDWSPIKIEGTYVKGTMFVGDSDSPYLMVQWWRPELEGHKSFDPKEWLKYRFKKLHALPEDNAPQAKGFDNIAWVCDLQAKEEESRTIWYGYSSSAEAVVEIIMTSLTPKDIRDHVVKSMIPSLKISGKGESQLWSLFSIHFLSPPGFIMDAYHLFLGDIAFSFKKEKESLMVRNVYPAGLAIQRRPLERWLDKSPFVERRKPKRGTFSEWKAQKFNRSGVIRKTWKSLPSPLGFVKPRFSSAVVAVDHDLDRLMIAEHQTRTRADQDFAEWALERMNAGENIC